MAATLQLNRPRLDGPGVREWIGCLGQHTIFAAAFDTRVKAPAALTGSASKAISRGLASHGMSVVAPPESFLVDKNGRLLPGEVARAAAWGATLAPPSGPNVARRRLKVSYPGPVSLDRSTQTGHGLCKVLHDRSLMALTRFVLPGQACPVTTAPGMAGGHPRRERPSASGRGGSADKRGNRYESGVLAAEPIGVLVRAWLVERRRGHVRLHRDAVDGVARSDPVKVRQKGDPERSPSWPFALLCVARHRPGSALTGGPPRLRHALWRRLSIGPV